MSKEFEALKSLFAHISDEKLLFAKHDYDIICEALDELQELRDIREQENNAFDYQKSMADYLRDRCDRQDEILEIYRKHLSVVKGYIFTKDSRITNKEYESLKKELL